MIILFFPEGVIALVEVWVVVVVVVNWVVFSGALGASTTDTETPMDIGDALKSKWNDPSVNSR